MDYTKKITYTMNTKFGGFSLTRIPTEGFVSVLEAPSKVRELSAIPCIYETIKNHVI